MHFNRFQVMLSIKSDTIAFITHCFIRGDLILQCSVIFLAKHVETFLWQIATTASIHTIMTHQPTSLAIGNNC